MQQNLRLWNSSWMKMLSGASISRSRNWKKGPGYQLTSGERKRYQILMSPSAHKIYRKFDSHLQRKIKEKARKMSEDPYRYEELKGPLKGIRSYHLDYKNTEYRIAYRIVENKNRIEIVLVKTRKSFYQILRQIIGK